MSSHVPIEAEDDDDAKVGRQAGDRDRGASGIGRATAEVIAGQGAAVLVADLDLRVGRADRCPVRCRGRRRPSPRRCDVRDEDARSRALHRGGGGARRRRRRRSRTAPASRSSSTCWRWASPTGSARSTPTPAAPSPPAGSSSGGSATRAPRRHREHRLDQRVLRRPRHPGVLRVEGRGPRAHPRDGDRPCRRRHPRELRLPGLRRHAAAGGLPREAGRPRGGAAGGRRHARAEPRRRSRRRSGGWWRSSPPMPRAS